MARAVRRVPARVELRLRRQVVGPLPERARRVAFAPNPVPQPVPSAGVDVPAPMVDR